MRRALDEVLSAFGVETVLDVPCGDVAWIRHLAGCAPGSCYVGADVSPVVVARNRELLPPPWRFEVCSATFRLVYYRPARSKSLDGPTTHARPQAHAPTCSRSPPLAQNAHAEQIADAVEGPKPTQPYLTLPNLILSHARRPRTQRRGLNLPNRTQSNPILLPPWAQVVDAVEGPELLALRIAGAPPRLILCRHMMIHLTPSENLAVLRRFEVRQWAISNARAVKGVGGWWGVFCIGPFVTRFKNDRWPQASGASFLLLTTHLRADENNRTFVLAQVGPSTKNQGA